MTSGAVGYDIYGGFDNVVGGAVNENSVTMTGGTVAHFIYGGKSSGLSNKNSVILGGDAIVGANTSSMVYGGYSAGANATGNAVTVNGAATAKGSVYGGFSNSATGDATGNTATLNSGTIGGDFIGGRAGKNANGNFVVINGGTVTGNVFGGQSLGGKDAINNSVTISGAANLANSILFGGARSAGTGDVFTGNTLNVNGFKGNVTGIRSFENINFSLSQPLADGDTILKVTGATSTDISASNIGVSFSGSTLALVGNRVSLLDASAGGLTGSVNREGVYGTSTAQGIWTYSLSTANDKLDLFVERLDIDALDAGGAYNMVAGAGSSQWVELDVHNQFSTTAFSIASSTQTATLRVDGTMKTGSFTAIKNTAALDVLVGTLDVSGGDTTLDLTDTTAWNGSTGVLFDTIALGGEKTLTVSGNGAFGFNHVRVRGKDTSWIGDLNASGKQMEFFLASNVSQNETMLTVEGGADMTASTVHVGVMGGGSPLNVGDKVVLIDSTVGVTGRPANAESHAEGMLGISLLYNFTLETTANQVLAYVASEGVNPQIKALSEGRAAGLGFINQGAELASTQGMLHAVSALELGGAAWRPVGFGAIGGGESRYNTGSHIDVSGFSLITGIAWGADLSGGKLALAPFFEMGRGKYDSYNSFSAASSVKGRGDANYYGGGLLARYDVEAGAFTGLYTEASARGGWVGTTFSSHDLHDSSGQQAHYDSGAAYFGGHAGLGYIWPLNGQDSLDFSSKYLWTRQNGDSVKVANDPIEFEASDSYRWRNGVRFNHALDVDTGSLSPYIGAAFEYEFDGKASATAYDRPITAPSLKGGAKIGELGLVYKPVASGDLSVDFGLQGYAGMREGFRGDLQLKCVF